jgi:hypothetical protein
MATDWFEKLYQGPACPLAAGKVDAALERLVAEVP